MLLRRLVASMHREGSGGAGDEEADDIEEDEETGSVAWLRRANAAAPSKFSGVPSGALSSACSTDPCSVACWETLASPTPDAQSGGGYLRIEKHQRTVKSSLELAAGWKMYYSACRTGGSCR